MPNARNGVLPGTSSLFLRGQRVSLTHYQDALPFTLLPLTPRGSPSSLLGHVASKGPSRAFSLPPHPLTHHRLAISFSDLLPTPSTRVRPPPPQLRSNPTGVSFPKALDADVPSPPHFFPCLTRSLRERRKKHLLSALQDTWWGREDISPPILQKKGLVLAWSQPAGGLRFGLIDCL